MSVELAKSRPRRLLGVLTAAVATISPQSATLAQSPSQILMLGDSAADSGTYAGERPVNQGNLWIETLAGRLGLGMSVARTITSDGKVVNEGGNNYAASGASVIRHMPFPVVTFADQVAQVQQDHATIAGDALVLLQFDSNDPGYAYLLGVPYDANAYADEYLRNVRVLQEMGARDLVAMADSHSLLPEGLYASIGYTPAEFEEHRQRMIASREALWPQLAAAGVYVVDIDRVAADVTGNLDKYGFTIGDDGWMNGNGPNDGHVFTHDGHYTAAMQDIFADFTLAQLSARAQFSHLLTQPVVAMRDSLATLEERMGARAFRSTGRDVGEWRDYADLSFATASGKPGGGLDHGAHANGDGGSAGADVLLSEGLLIGGRLDYRHDRGEFGAEAGSWTGDSVIATAYSSVALGHDFILNASASYGHTDYRDITRRARLGLATETATGQTSAHYWQAKIGLEHGAAVGDWLVTTSGTLAYERSEIGGYDESGRVLGLSYGDSSFDTLRLSLGVRADLGSEDQRFRPSLSLMVEQDLLDDDVVAQVGPTRSMLVGHALDRPERSAARAVFGSRYRLTDALDLGASVSVSRSLADDGRTGLAGHVNLSLRF